MKQQMMRQISVLRTTAIGGIFFLLPLVVILFLLGQIVSVLIVAATQVQPYLATFGLSDTTGLALVFLIAILLMVLGCFMAGLLARGRLAREFLQWVEKYLVMLFPRYAIFKEQLSGNIGGSISRNTLRPVRVQREGYFQLAFEVERSAAGSPGLVTVFVPGSPDPWNGDVICVTPDRVEPIQVPVPDVLGAFEKLGVDTQLLLRGERPT